MTLTLLTPLGLLVAVAGILPLAAFVLTRRRAERVREALHIESPGGRSPLSTAAAIVLLTALLSIAVAQPALRKRDERRVRTDAEAFYVFDVSRSMLASKGPTGATRLDRAQRVALRLRAELQEVPSGIAGLTDRVLPNLFPTSDDEVFTATVEQSVGVDRPPPRGVETVTTLFAAFDTMAGDNFFDPGIEKRVVVFFTDGESAPYDREALRAVFVPQQAGETPSVGSRGLPALGGAEKETKIAKAVPTRFVIMRLWDRDERIYIRGKEVNAYEIDPESERITSEFAEDVRGAVVEEGDVDGMVRAVRSALGEGPTEESGRTLRVVPLARWFLLASLIPLLGLLWRRNLV